MGGRNIRILVAYEAQYCYTNAVADYVSAFGQNSRFDVLYLDPSVGYNVDLSGFDAVIVNYCVTTMIDKRKRFFDKLQKYRGVKIIAVQDEYDNAIKHHERIASVGFDAIITSVPHEKDRRTVYWGKKFAETVFIHSLTGYAAEELKLRDSWVPMREREWVLGYRARKLSARYGLLGYDKWRIGEEMKKECRRRGIIANIETSEESRIYGEAWPKFIGNCRAMLGTESGSNVFDFSGKLSHEIAKYEVLHPKADFMSVYNRFLKDADGKILMNQASPRLFEMIGHGTVGVLFEGEYSGVVKPWRHYIPLKKDFSNLDEVFSRLEDTDSLQEMAETAYEDVILSGKWSYATLVKRVDDFIESRVGTPKGRVPVCNFVCWEDEIGKDRDKTVAVATAPSEYIIRKWLPPLPKSLKARVKKTIKRPLKKAFSALGILETVKSWRRIYSHS